MKRTIFIVVVFFAATLYAQDIDKNISENPRVKKPVGLSFNLGGPTYVASASIDYFILPVLNIETGAGIWGYYIGPKYHFKGNRNNGATAYAGALVSVYPPSSSSEWSGWNLPPPETHYEIYLPVGITNISANGYTFSIEIAYSSQTLHPDIPFWFSLKFGYHF